MGSKKLNVREIYVYIGHKSVEDPEEEYLYQAEKFHYNEEFTRTFNPMTQMFAFDRGGDVAVLKLKGKINFEHLKGKAEKVPLFRCHFLPLFESPTCLPFRSVYPLLVLNH